jgi:3-oxoadipate enol-lactonase
MEIEANGLRVSYTVEGDGPQWVTLITGIANDYSMWDAQAAALRPHFRVLRYDLRGQGGTQATPPPYSISLFVEDLIALWDALGIQKSHLAGLGLGGAIAQAAAISHPARIEKLVPCCCRAKMVPEFAVLWHTLMDTVKRDGMESIVEQTAQRWFSEAFKKANPAVLDGVRNMIRRTSLDGYLGCVSAFLGLALDDQLALIRAPTLYVSGADDKIGGPPALMAGLAAKVPGARHTSVENSAHIANIQNPAGFNRILLDFLK